ncbi:MAG: hypothetical protein MJ112_04455 [Lachnospiraceae bacterium]|nr:hypothetical protein [Lachnospiraceae bacterium]
MGNTEMSEEQMIEDLLAQLEGGFAKGAGHINACVEESTQSKTVQTMGCTDCSRTPLACSVPTFEDASLDDYK